jgi:hypothetical protein
MAAVPGTAVVRVFGASAGWGIVHVIRSAARTFAHAPVSGLNRQSGSHRAPRRCHYAVRVSRAAQRRLRNAEATERVRGFIIDQTRRDCAAFVGASGLYRLPPRARCVAATASGAAADRCAIACLVAPGVRRVFARFFRVAYCVFQ